MRTNYSGFALAVSMGLIVLLIGFLALSAGGLVQIGPVEAVAEEQMQCEGEGPLADSLRAIEAAYKPVTAEQMIGEKLFKANCAQCHAVDYKVVGPALVNLTKRRSISWIVPWVHNSAKVIASGDEYAVKIFSDYNQQQMPSFPQLTKQEIAAIVAYVSLADTNAPAVSATTIAVAN